MAREDFGELRSALHARRLDDIESLLTRATPEAHAYAFAHLDRWEEGNLWEMGLSPSDKPLFTLPELFEDEDVRVSRVLRLLDLRSGETLYQRTVWSAPAARALHQFSWQMVQDVLDRFNLGDQPYLTRAMASKRSWLAQRVPLEALESTREAVQDRSPRDPLGLHGLSFRRWVGATLVYAATSPRADEAVWGMVEAMELPRFRDALLAPVSRGIGSTLDALLSGNVSRLLRTAETSVQRVLAGLSALTDPNVTAREGLDAALHDHLMTLAP